MLAIDNAFTSHTHEVLLRGRRWRGQSLFVLLPRLSGGDGGRRGRVVSRGVRSLVGTVDND